MYVGRYYDFPRSSFYTSYSVESCQKQSCPGLNYWNPMCQLNCHMLNAGHDVQKSGSQGINDAVTTATKSAIDTWNGQMAPTFYMLGIAAVGLIAVFLVMR